MSNTANVTAPQTITADLTQLSDLIAQSVAKAMGQLLQQGQGAKGLDSAELGTVIGNAVADGIHRTERKKITVGEFMLRVGTSPFHEKTSMRTQPKLVHQCYQNGALIFDNTAYDEEINLLNSITHSGRYCDKLVEVIVTNEGQVDQTVDIRFPNRSVDDRMNVALASRFDNRRHKSQFHAMLEQIKNTQDAERKVIKDRNEAKAVKPAGHFGRSKAYQEAVARVAAEEAVDNSNEAGQVFEQEQP